MSILLSPRQALLVSLPDWSDLMARFGAMSSWTSLEGHMIRAEEQLDNGHYTLRAELRGIDPDKDVDIAVAMVT